MKEQMSTVLVGLVALVLGYFVNDWLTGRDEDAATANAAQIANIADKQIEEALKTDSGKSVKAVLVEVNERTIRIEAAVQALASE